MGSLFILALVALIKKNLKLKVSDKRGLLAEIITPLILCFIFSFMGNVIPVDPSPASLDTVTVSTLNLATMVDEIFERYARTDATLALIPPNHPLSVPFKNILSSFNPYPTKYDLLTHVVEFDSVKAVFRNNEKVVKNQKDGKTPEIRPVTALIDFTSVNLNKKDYTYHIKDINVTPDVQPQLADIYVADDQTRIIRLMKDEIAISNIVKYAVLLYEGYGAGETDLKKLNTLDVNLNTMPTLQTSSTIISKYFNSILAGTFTTSLSAAAQSVVSILVTERECLIRSTFIMMGASKYLLYLSHLVSQFVVSTIPLLICAGMIKHYLYKLHSILVLIPFLLFYFCAVTVFCFFISTFFSKVKTAISAMSIVFVLFSVIGMAQTVIPPAINQIIMFFNFQTTFVLANRTLHYFHVHNEAVNFFTHFFAHQHDTISLAQAFGLFTFQCLFYFMLTLYMDNIMPGEYNNPLPFYYPLTPSYWKSFFNDGVVNSSPRNDAYTPLLNGEGNSPAHRDTTSSRFIEPYSPQEQQQIGVRINNVSKEFSTSNGVVRAVDNLSLNLIKNQISVLLGHNGSGKSTTVSMVSGLYPPTSGEIDVYDKHGNKLYDVTGHIGICMQQNTLLEKLTVMDHMMMFSAIKQHSMGIELSESQVMEEIMDLLNRLKLGPLGDDKVLAQVNTLSGGQKRKVCLALALLHKPTVVILDECTTGVDISIQRQIWKLVQEEKSRDGGKSILLLTHSLEEAEIGDRISILVKGQLMTSGKSSFLKSAFNVGYLLQLDKVKQPGVFDRLHKTDTSINRDTTNKKFGDANELNNINTKSGLAIQSHLDSNLPQGLAEKLSVHTDTQHHIIFSIDLNDSDHLPSIIDAIDNMKSDLHITNTALSITSLTDVFLMANTGYTQQFDDDQDGEDNSNIPQGSINHSTKSKSSISSSKSNLSDAHSININTEIWDSERVHMHFIILFFLQVWAIFWKRVLVSCRDLKSTAKITLFPLVTIGILVWFSRSNFIGSSVTLDYRYFPRPANIEYSTITGADPKITAANAFSSAFATYDSTTPIPSDLTNYVHYDRPDGPHQRSFTFDSDKWMPVFNKSVDNYPFTSPRYVAINTWQANVDTESHTATISADIYLNSTSMWTPAAYSARFFEQLAEQVGLPPLHIVENIQGMPVPVIADILRGAVLLGIFLCCIIFPPAIIFLLVKEREDKIFHLHRISGLSSSAYFIANFLFDGLQYIMMCGILMAGIAIFDLPMIPTAVTSIIRALAAYGIISILFVYALSFLFKKPATAQVVVSLVLTIGPMAICGIIATILSILRYRGDWNTFLKIAYLIPSAGLGLSFTNIIMSQYSEVEDISHVTLKWLISSPIYLVLLITLNIIHNYRLVDQLFEKTINITPQPDGTDIDEGVAKQEAFVKSGEWRNDTEQNPLVVSGLRKVYGKHTAVNNIHFSIPRNSIVGLLGANGSGKSTTMNLLVADIWASPSLESKYDPTVIHDAYIFGHSIKQEPSKGYKHLGYCPQFDAFNLELTARQTLRMYCHLRGVVGLKCEAFINDLLNVLGLEYAADRPASGYSLGMRRRLSVGLAMSGNPEVLLLDECASGLDPISRKSIQLLLQQTCKNRTVLMTEHDMGQVDALCDSLLIMARSNLKAAGTQSELKEKLGSEFTIQLTCESGLEDFTACYVMSQLTNTPINSQLQNALDHAVFEKKRKDDEHKKLLHEANGAPLSPIVSEYVTHGESDLHKSNFYRHFLFECQANGIRIAEQRHATISLNIQKQLYPLSGLFNNVKKIRDTIPNNAIQTYACSQIPIDQVFMEIVRQDEAQQNMSTVGSLLEQQNIAFQQYQATQAIMQSQQQYPQQSQYLFLQPPQQSQQNLFTPAEKPQTDDGDKKL